MIPCQATAPAIPGTTRTRLHAWMPWAVAFVLTGPTTLPAVAEEEEAAPRALEEVVVRGYRDESPDIGGVAKRPLAVDHASLAFEASSFGSASPRFDVGARRPTSLA